jgi:hypothetical protein
LGLYDVCNNAFLEYHNGKLYLERTRMLHKRSVRRRRPRGHSVERVTSSLHLQSGTEFIIRRRRPRGKGILAAPTIRYSIYDRQEEAKRPFNGTGNVLAAPTVKYFSGVKFSTVIMIT